MLKLEVIKPCPEIFGWNKKETPPEELCIYLYLKKYGYCCLVFHPYLRMAYIHAKPELNGKKFVDMRVVKNYFYDICKRLSDDCDYLIASYDEKHKPTQLIVKFLNRLGFVKINDYTYMKEI